jgi:hypothetical protein
MANIAYSLQLLEEFWYAGCTLWTAQTDLKKTAGQDYLDLPFSITIPPMVQPSQRRKACMFCHGSTDCAVSDGVNCIADVFVLSNILDPMPPSFILTTTRSYDTGGIDSASIR